MTGLPLVHRVVPSWPLAREVGFPVLAVAAIAVSADMRMPIGLPGHRGLVWLTLLVAVALVTRTRETVIAVGAASTATLLMLQAAPADSSRYLVAAVLLYAVGGIAAERWRAGLIALAAAPIHLVALAGAHGWMGAVGMPEKALFHLGFGLAAGVLGWAVAGLLDRPGRLS